jgi:hypothetical protein
MNRSIFSKFFRSHTTGEIKLKINGDEITLDNVDITLKINENSEINSSINNGRFRFLKGDKGSNMCIFRIPAELFNGKEDVICHAEYISSNNWHINDFHINIAIVTSGDIKIYANGFVKTKSEKEPCAFNEISKLISENDSTIMLYASGI